MAPARPDFLILGLAAAGFAIAAYLTGLKWMGGNAAFCLSGSGCDVVQASRYGSLLGVPTALWGVLLYAAIGALAALGLTAPRWTWALYLAAAGVGFSIYLTAVSVLVIKATCAYCLASGAITVAILFVLLRRRAALPRRRRLGALVPGALAAAVLVPLGAAFIYAVPAGGGSGFGGVQVVVEHAVDRRAAGDVVEHDQAAGAAADAVNGRPDLCQQAGVKSFPTWVMGTERREGTQSLRALADFSKFEAPK